MNDIIQLTICVLNALEPVNYLSTQASIVGDTVSKASSTLFQLPFAFVFVKDCLTLEISTSSQLP